MGKRGPPTITPTADDRAKVRELLAKKSPITDLAKLFGVSPPTFRKLFRGEISTERATKPALPPRKITTEMRAKVKRYIGCKMPMRQVAYALGYETDEEAEAFKDDFRREIEVGAALYRAQVLDKLHDQMGVGMVGALNKLEKLTQIVEPVEPSQVKAQGYVGKKAAASAAAHEAAAGGGKFAPRTPPKLAAVGGQRLE